MKTQTIFSKVKLLIPALLLGASVSAQTIDPAQDPDIESHVKSFLNVLNSGTGKPMEQLTPVEARAVLTGAQSSVKVDLSGIEVAEKTIKAEGQDLKLTIVRPAGNKGKLPVFMFFHGGGWVLGDFDTHERLVRDPVAINQAYAATVWVAAHFIKVWLPLTEQSCFFVV